tara:strand:+ start:881 stop:1144 length:264 start_codon:yes stop_codon:yes gene_type:complete
LEIWAIIGHTRIPNMIFQIDENTQVEAVFNPTFDNISLREVSAGGDPLEDFVDFDPIHGASSEEWSTICDEILQTMRNIHAQQDANW